MTERPLSRGSEDHRQMLLQSKDAEHKDLVVCRRGPDFLAYRCLMAIDLVTSLDLI